MCYGGLATFALPSVSFAQVRGASRLVFVLLRGGFDGLAAVVPYGDPDYRSLRDSFAFSTSELVTLDDTFGLAPGLSPLRTLWDANELAVVHAMAIPQRTRSHFDGQAILETGLDHAGASDGWLNRLLQVMSGKRSGIAIAAGMPLSLTGSFQVESWSPTQLGAVDDAFLERLAVLYRSDRTLANRFEAALQQKDLVGEEPMARGNARRGGAIAPLMQAAAKILKQDQGPNIAAMEFSGWDTHANQGLAGGPLDRLLGQLAEGLVALRTDMGQAWPNTTVVVMTEFGRTARPNGTRGTDHGTAGAGFVLGTRVGKSHVVADWPGLANKSLFEGRDVKPTLDTRAVLKAALSGTFDLTAAQLEKVFPGSAAVRPAAGLIA
jgi:uncharacterized protein (DUF1501 family)